MASLGERRDRLQQLQVCLAVEKLLGITDQIPERAGVIRVMMMELMCAVSRCGRGA